MVAYDLSVLLFLENLVFSNAFVLAKVEVLAMEALSSAAFP